MNYPVLEAVGLGGVVARKFRLDRVLAEGGMGIVMAATHLQLDRMVALKFFRDASPTSSDDARDSLLGEAKAAARLRSEHVARVLDVDQAEDGAPYIVMEYLDGRSLADVLKVEGRLSAARVADYAIQVCEGLAEAHSCGIVHRDIKPENLFLAEQGPYGRVVKILDFGISNVATQAAQNDAVQAMTGSPPYMSPEQLQSSSEVDHRSDLWSLGVTLYELLTGSTPFPSSLPLPELAAAIRFGSPTPLRQFRDDVPAGMIKIVNRCLAKNPNDRFQSAADLARALFEFAPESARISVQHASSMPPAGRPGIEVEVASRSQNDGTEASGLRRYPGAAAGISATLRSMAHVAVRPRREVRITTEPRWSPPGTSSEDRSWKRLAFGALVAAFMGAIALGYRLETRHFAPATHVAAMHAGFSKGGR